MPQPPTHPAEDTVDAFVRGRLPAEDRLRLENHLDGCADCQQIAVRVLSQLPEPVAASLRASQGAWAPRAELQAGDKVGRHIVIERLGAGGMGTVYAAYDTTLDRKIALKFLSGADEAAVARLVAEASAMARLTHPNVVTVHDVGVVDGQPFLAMEYVEGATLGDWRREQPRSVREILEVMAAVARGLEAAHAAGIIHRDVKPHNVLVSGERVLVTDFGLSVRDGAGGTAAVAGTPGYMAPEQFRGEPVTRATDVFGFSATLHHILYDQLPFGDGTLPEIERRVMANRVTPRPAGGGVPNRVHRLIAAGLSVDPAARPASMGDIADVLLANPGRAIGRFVAFFGTAAAVVAAFWGGGYLKADPQRRCQAGASAMDSVWSDARRQDLRKQYTPDVLAIAEPRFQEYADRWRAMQGATCQAAHGDHQISGELFDLRMNCLGSHRATFDALLGSVPGATPAQRLKLAAAPLPPVAECAMTERPATKPLPPDPADRKRIGDINDMIARANAQMIQAEYGKGRQLTTEAVAAARTLGYEPLLARALLLQARVDLRGVKAAGPSSVRPDQAVKVLEEAVAIAEIGRDDGVRAEAATELAIAHRDAGTLADAERWAKLASSVIARVGNPPAQRGSLDYVLGWIAYDRGEMKVAEAAFERSLRLRREAFGPRAVDTLGSMAGTCHAKVDRKEKIACYRQAVTLARTVVGPRHADFVFLNSNLASALKEDARTRPEACKLLADGLPTLEAALEPSHNGVIAHLQLLADCVKDEGKDDEAKRIYLDALRRATTPSAVRGDLRQGYGIFLARHDDFDGAIRELRGAIADRQAVYGATHNMTVESRYGLADMLRRQKHLPEALQEIDETIAACEKAGASPTMYPDLHELRGLTLWRMNRLPEAYQSLQRSVELHEKQNTPPPLRFFVLQSIGAFERETGRLDAAVEHLEKAMALRPLEEDPQSFAEAAMELAMALEAKGRPFRTRACTLAQQSIVGFGAPRGGNPRTEIETMRRWMAKKHCPKE